MGVIAVEVDSPPPYGVYEGPDRLHEMLLCNFGLVHIYRRRMMRYETMDRHGCVAIAIEVS